MLKKIIFIFSLLLSLSHVFAQTAAVRGFVYDKENGEPIIFTNVYLQGTTHGASTDVNGYYSITKVPVGNYTLTVSYIGYDTLKIPLSLAAGDVVTKKLYITQKTVNLNAIEISAEKQAAQTETRISVTKITPKEIKQLPSVGGEPDLSQYLQVLPGVVFTGDQGGQLYIRGGSPVQNKVLLDGMVVYNPFHSIGFFSVFDTDILRNIDVYAGGFGAEYGGRISSVMDITTRDGNKKRLAGKVAVSPFTSKVILEGPISRAKVEGEGSTSFILSAKTSYLEQSSKFFYKYLEPITLPYTFMDFYGKVSFNATNGSKLNVFGFDFRDKVNYQNVSDLRWGSLGFGSDFVLVPGSSSVLIKGSFAYSQYGIALTEADNKPRTDTINGFNMGLNFTYFLAKDEINYGIEIQGYSTNFDFYNYVGREISQKEYTTDLAGFFKYKKVWNKFLFEPSFRAHYYASLDEFSPEPRLGGKYNVNNKLRLKFGGGWYSQNLISTSSDKDIVNLFSGYLSGKGALPETFNGKPVTSKLQKSRHAIFGFEYDLPKHFELNVEAYIKLFDQLTNINRNKLYEDNGDNYLQPDSLKKDYIIETGQASGIDFVLKYDYKRMYLWFVYSLGFSTRTDGVYEYTPQFDRRHNVNLVGSYTFGKDLNWEIDARWNWGSGFPFTQTAGNYEYLNFAQGISTNYTTTNGNLGTIYGEPNQGRLSDYHRLDITLKRKFELTKNSTLEANANVINVYSRKNIFYVNRITGDKVEQLPILPSVGVSLTF